MTKIPPKYHDEILTVINRIKHDYKGDFNLSSFRSEMRNTNCPYHVAVITMLTTHGYIVKADTFARAGVKQVRNYRFESMLPIPPSALCDYSKSPITEIHVKRLLADIAYLANNNLPIVYTHLLAKNKMEEFPESLLTSAPLPDAITSEYVSELTRLYYRSKQQQINFQEPEKEIESIPEKQPANYSQDVIYFFIIGMMKADASLLERVHNAINLMKS